MPGKKNRTATQERSLYTGILLISALCLMTVAAFLAYPKYRITGEELLVNNNFTGEFSGWEKQGDPNNFRPGDDFIELSQNAPWQSTRLTQVVKPSIAGSYLLSGELSTVGLTAGKESWQRGGLLLLRLDEGGERIGSYDVVSLDGDLSWAKHRAYIDVPQPTAGIMVVARLLEATGALRVKSLSLLPAEQQPGFETLRIALITLWSLTILALVGYVIRRYGFTRPLIILSLLASFAFVGTLMPRDAVIGLDAHITSVLPDALTNAIKQTFNTVLPGYIKHANQEISKLGHWLVFLLLGFTSALYFKRYSLWLCGLALLAMAATTETLQLLTDARSASTRDLLIDGAGILVGLLLAAPFRPGRRRD